MKTQQQTIIDGGKKFRTLPKHRNCDARQID